MAYRNYNAVVSVPDISSYPEYNRYKSILASVDEFDIPTKFKDLNGSMTRRGEDIDKVDKDTIIRLDNKLLNDIYLQANASKVLLSHLTSELEFTKAWLTVSNIIEGKTQAIRDAIAEHLLHEGATKFRMLKTYVNCTDSAISIIKSTTW